MSPSKIQHTGFLYSTAKRDTACCKIVRLTEIGRFFRELTIPKKSYQGVLISDMQCMRNPALRHFVISSCNVRTCMPEDGITTTSTEESRLSFDNSKISENKGLFLSLGETIIPITKEIFSPDCFLLKTERIFFGAGESILDFFFHPNNFFALRQ